MQNVIEELHGRMELLVRDFVDLGFRIGLLNAASVQRAMEEVEGTQHERNANVTYVHLEVHLGHLGLGLVAGQHFVLFFHGFIGLLLLLLMLCLSPDANGLEHETLHLEHVERVVLLDSDLVLSYVLKQLLEERIVRVFDQVK